MYDAQMSPQPDRYINAVLTALKEHPEDLTARQLVDITGYDRSAVYSATRTLRIQGPVEKDGRVYRLISPSQSKEEGF